MKKSIGGMFVVVLGLGLVACNVEHYDDCDGDSFDYEGDAGGSRSLPGKRSLPSAGTSATAGSASSGGPSPDGTAEGGAPPVVVPPDTCDQERDCKPGFNCNAETHECETAAEETCGELDTEVACTHRSDCTPIYGGTNCSCGQDCECQGGEPGCICESFEFFVCRAAE